MRTGPVAIPNPAEVAFRITETAAQIKNLMHNIQNLASIYVGCARIKLFFVQALIQIRNIWDSSLEIYTHTYVLLALSPGHSHLSMFSGVTLKSWEWPGDKANVP